MTKSPSQCLCRRMVGPPLKVDPRSIRPRIIELPLRPFILGSLDSPLDGWTSQRWQAQSTISMLPRSASQVYTYCHSRPCTDHIDYISRQLLICTDLEAISVSGDTLHTSKIRSTWCSCTVPSYST